MGSVSQTSILCPPAPWPQFIVIACERSTNMGDIICTDDDSSSPNNIPSISSDEELPQAVSVICAICGDDATGKHYGSISCDGCKGFFRRSVRRRVRYVCRHSRDCPITKDKRNTCRYCRLRKCFKCGMKKEAVQNERDKITRHRPSDMFLPCLSVESLRKVHAESREFCNDRFGPNPCLGENREANLSTLCAALKLFSCSFMEWVARLSPFNELSVESRILLCKSKVVPLFVFELAYRSIHANDVIVLPDNCIIPTSFDGLDNTNGFDTKKIASQILEELVNPLTDYQIDEKEFACLNAALLFDPRENPYVTTLEKLGLDVRGLAEDTGKIRNWRHQITSNLMEYVYARETDDERNARCAEMWLLLLPLQRIGYQLIDLIQYAVLCGQIPIDSLANDVLSGSANLLSSTPDRLTPRFMGDVAI